MAKTIIGFDAKRAFSNFTGLGNYSRFIIRLAIENGLADSFIAYTPKLPSERAKGFVDSHKPLRSILPAGIWKRFGSLWRSFGITRRLERDGVTIYHGLSNELPLNIKRARKVKSVVTMHDVIYLKLKKDYPLTDRLIYNFKYGRACRNADGIIAVSECTKRDVIKHYHVPASKVQVIYQGCDAAFRAKVSEKDKTFVKEKYNLPERFILCVGTIEKRKNALVILKAMEKLDQSVSLVLVGKRTAYCDRIADYARARNLSGRLICIHGAATSELPAIYHLASVFVYPSRYEGFGIPVLEALCCGVPVIAATGSCLEEAGGPGSIYLHPDDSDGFAREIGRVLADGEAKRRMTEAGLEYAKRFSEDRLASELKEYYESIITE